MDYAWLAPVLPIGAFALNVLIWRQMGARKHALSALTTLAAIGGAFLVFLAVFSDASAHLEETATSSGRHLIFEGTPWFTVGVAPHLYVFAPTLVVDWLSIMMLGVVTFLAFLIEFYATGYMKGDNRYWWFFSVKALFTAAMLGVVLSYNFLLMYICWELVGLCSFLLIGFWYSERANAEAAKKAFITTRVGDVGFFIGLALLFLKTGTFDMKATFAAVESGAIDPATVTIAGILIFLGAMGKSGQFPLHVWLPDAMAGPTPVSALVHSATMVAAGVYLVGRAYPIFHASPTTMGVITTVGTITAIFAATIALTQRDIKRILAYSTISQLGYMIMALGVGAYTAGLFHLFTHAFFKALLFLGAGSVIHSMEPVLHGTGRNPNDIFNMGGLRKQMPVTFWTFLLASLSLAGIAPLAGFWSKDAILVGAYEADAWLPLIVALFTAFLTAFYMFRCIYLVFFGPARWQVATASADHHDNHSTDHVSDHHAEPHESPWTMALPLVLICVPAIAAGWIGIPGFSEAFAETVRFGPMIEEHINLVLAGAGTLAGLLGIGLATLMYLTPVSGPRLISESFPAVYKTLYNKYYFDEMYQWIIDHVVLAIAAMAATVDRKILNDRIVDWCGPFLQGAGARLRLTTSGYIYHYAFGFIIGIMAIGVVMSGGIPDMRFALW